MLSSCDIWDSVICMSLSVSHAGQRMGTTFWHASFQHVMQSDFLTIKLALFLLVIDGRNKR